MQQYWLSRIGTPSLTLLFRGWAIGAAAFVGMISDDDVLLVHDYSSLDDPLRDLAQYDRVNLIAFSFGVASAVHWMAGSGFQPARLVAIGGTLSPASDDKGIAPALIRATADTLSDESMAT